MGHLDEKKFAQAIAGCAKCDAKAFEVQSYIDRQLSVMLARANQDGRWTHDGEKFIDGTFRIKCIGCSTEAYTTEDCPRCHRAGGLAEAMGNVARLTVPKRCPTCKGTELTVMAFVPARVRTGEGRPGAPTAIAQFGDAGFHISGIMCEGCDWVAAPRAARCAVVPGCSANVRERRYPTNVISHSRTSPSTVTSMTSPVRRPITALPIGDIGVTTDR